MKENQVIRLAWDSAFFDLEIGAITFKNGYPHLEQKQILENTTFDLLYLFSDIPLPKEQFGKYIDKKVVYKKKATSSALVNSNISLYKGKVNDDLIHLAIQSGAYSRFKKDPQLAPGFERLYTTWVENSVEKSLADEVWVYQLYGYVVGFVTLKHKESFSEIGLIAIMEQYRGKGIGTALLNRIASRLSPSKEIHVATQADNHLACHFYEKNAYHCDTITYVYHLWR